MRYHCPRSQTIVFWEGLPVGSEPVRPENPYPEDAGGAHDPVRDDAMVPRVPNLPPQPSARQIPEHELTGHAVCRSWCRHFVASKGRAHTLPERKESCQKSARGGEDMLPILCVKCRNSSTGCMGATVVDRKGCVRLREFISDCIHQESGIQENPGEIRQRTIIVELDRTSDEQLDGC